MRFFWKATPDSMDHQGVKCKIMRPVSLCFCVSFVATAVVSTELNFPVGVLALRLADSRGDLWSAFRSCCSVGCLLPAADACVSASAAVAVAAAVAPPSILGDLPCYAGHVRVLRSISASHPQGNLKRNRRNHFRRLIFDTSNKGHACVPPAVKLMRVVRAM